MTAEPESARFQPVGVTRGDGVLTVQLQRPARRNALTGDMLRRLEEVLAPAPQDSALRLVVLRAEGTDFCTGLDLDEVYRAAEQPPEWQLRESERIGAVLRSLFACRAPTVAIVQGRALGIGATLAVACDVVFAASNAQIGFPELSYGFLPAFASVVVSRASGRKAAVELLASGRIIRADEAWVLGLVSRVIPEEGFAAVTGSCVKGLCACAAELLVDFKELYRTMEGLPLDQAIDVAARMNARARASQAFRDAARQFLAMT